MPSLLFMFNKERGCWTKETIILCVRCKVKPVMSHGIYGQGFDQACHDAQTV